MRKKTYKKIESTQEKFFGNLEHECNPQKSNTGTNWLAIRNKSNLIHKIQSRGMNWLATRNTSHLIHKIRNTGMSRVDWRLERGSAVISFSCCGVPALIFVCISIHVCSFFFFFCILQGKANKIIK